MKSKSRLLGYRGGIDHGVSTVGARPVLSTVPRRLTVEFILPRAGALFRVRVSLRPALPPSPSTETDDSCERDPPGVPCSLFATSTRSVHLSRRAPSSTLRSVLGVPPAHDGLLRCVPCGLVPSHSHVQGLLSRVNTSRSRAGSSPAAALLSLDTLVCSRNCADEKCPRLQGFAPHDGYDGLRRVVRPIRTPRPS